MQNTVILIPNDGMGQADLNYFGLTDQVKVGLVGGMGDILESQARAEKVITL